MATCSLNVLSFILFVVSQPPGLMSPATLCPDKSTLCPVGGGTLMRQPMPKPPNHKCFDGVMGERKRLSWMPWARVAGTLGRQVPSRISTVLSVVMTSPSTSTSTRRCPVPSSLLKGSQCWTGCGRHRQLWETPFMGKPWILGSKKPTRCFGVGVGDL